MSRQIERIDLVLDPLANHVQLALERPFNASRGFIVLSAESRTSPDEQLPEHGLHGDRTRADQPIVGRQLSPAQKLLPFLDDDALDEPLNLVAFMQLTWKKDQAGPVLSSGGQRKAHDTAQELVGHLDQNARAITSVGLAPTGSAMQQIDEHLEGFAHNRVRALPLDVHDKPHSAGVVFLGRTIETLVGRGPGFW